jgi:hypothetical protein
MLQDSSARVATLRERCLASTSVTQAIAGCFMDIDRYLADYLLSFQIQSQHDIHEELMILRRQQEYHQKLLITVQSLVIGSQSSMGPSASLAAIALDCVTLVDATGHHHAISVNCCSSYQQLNNILRVLLDRDVVEAQIQRRYIEKGEYDLCIDEGTQVTPLTSHEWSSIEAGTKIVMRVTIQQEAASLSEVDYKCHFCGAVNRLGIGSVRYQSRGRAVCSTDCRECKRRFQITRTIIPVNRGIQSSNSDSNRTTDTEMRLIRNFHIQQSKHDLLYYLLLRDDYYAAALYADDDLLYKAARRRRALLLLDDDEQQEISLLCVLLEPRPCPPDQVMSCVHMTYIMGTAASRRSSKAVTRRRGKWARG